MKPLVPALRDPLFLSRSTQSNLADAIALKYQDLRRSAGGQVFAGEAE